MYDKIKEDIISAMKSQDKETTTVLRLLKGAIDKEHIDKKVDISDQLVIDIISREIKQRNESITEFSKGNRTDLVEKCEKEIELLKTYLPEQLTDEELNIELDNIFNDIKPSGMKDMGVIMKEASKLKGRVDMTYLSSEIKKRLSNIKD